MCPEAGTSFCSALCLFCDLYGLQEVRQGNGQGVQRQELKQVRLEVHIKEWTYPSAMR